MKDSLKSGQTSITTFFDFKMLCQSIENDIDMRERINDFCGKAKESSVAPLLQRLFDNARNNGCAGSKHANRHDLIIKQFAAALVILIGKSGYDLLQANLGQYYLIFFTTIFH